MMTLTSTVSRYAAVAVLGLGLVACQNQGGGTGIGTKTGIGAAAGAAGGGLLASQLGGGATGIAAGVLLGGLLGGAAGNLLDQQDERYHTQATRNTLYTGQATSWQNPETGHSGTVQPVRTYQADAGNLCREFQQTIVVGGRTETAYGTACRQADGSWKIVS